MNDRSNICPQDHGKVHSFNTPSETGTLRRQWILFILYIKHDNCMQVHILSTKEKFGKTVGFIHTYMIKNIVYLLYKFFFTFQILVLSGLPNSRPVLVDFAYLLTKNLSLLVCGHVLRQSSQKYRNYLQDRANSWFKRHRVKGFYSLVDDEDFDAGCRALMQVRICFIIIRFILTKLEKRTTYIYRINNNAKFCKFFENTFGIAWILHCCSRASATWLVVRGTSLRLRRSYLTLGGVWISSF